MKKGKNPVLAKSFSEVFDNKPRAVAATERKFGKKRARKQAIAIAFSKARAAGARVPKK